MEEKLIHDARFLTFCLIMAQKPTFWSKMQFFDFFSFQTELSDSLPNLGIGDEIAHAVFLKIPSRQIFEWMTRSPAQDYTSSSPTGNDKV